jgi:hypothetical protein
MSDTQDVTYTGPHLEVEIVDYKTGFLFSCARGATVTVPTSVADSLLEQGEDHWTKATKTKKKEG